MSQFPTQVGIKTLNLPPPPTPNHGQEGGREGAGGRRTCTQEGGREPGGEGLVSEVKVCLAFLDGVWVSVGEAGEVDPDLCPGPLEAVADAVAGALLDAVGRHVRPEEEGLPPDGDGRGGGGEGGDRSLEVALAHPAPGSHAAEGTEQG